MQTEITFSQELKKNAISFEQASQLLKIQEFKNKVEKEKSTYWHLMGNKKGAWGRMTMADEKRGQKLDKLRNELARMEAAYNLKYL
jgi:hypothetical protein